MNWLRRISYLLRSESLFYLAKIVRGKRDISIKTIEGYNFDNITDIEKPLKPIETDLSIIIPVYNSEKFLGKCLDSILTQKTKYQYEVICVNDGSKDRSLEILEDFASKHTNIKIISQENQGISGARNTGLENAKGRYIGFLDNDDYVSPLYVETLLNRAAETDADIIHSAYQDVDNEGHILSIISRGNSVLEHKDYVRRMFTLPGFIWGGCMKRELFEKVRFPLGFWYEDMIMRMLIIRQSTKIAFIETPLYNYLKHGDNASLTLWKRNDIKSLDELWLALQLTEYGNNTLNLPVDDYIYTALLDEWSALLWVRTKALKQQTRQTAFLMAAEYIQNLNYKYTNNNNNNNLYKAIEESFMQRDFLRWRMLSKSLLLKRCYYL